MATSELSLRAKRSNSGQRGIAFEAGDRFAALAMTGVI
jgi:hypothetical protein